LNKTVVVVDLIGYSSIARSLEQNITAQAVAELNRQIQSFVDAGLAAVSGNRERNLMNTTGDGAILLFDSAEQAHRFGKRFHESAFEHSQQKTEESAKRWFRVGIATGELVSVDSNGAVEYAGTTIADAVRLEAASGPGEMLMDVPTWSRLPRAIQVFYGPEETVSGKRDEKFPARRYRVLPGSPRVEKHEPSQATREPSWDKRREALKLMQALQTPGDLDKLIWLIEIPVAQRPTQNVTLDQRRSEVLLWADTNKGCGVEVLLESLKVVLGFEGTILDAHPPDGRN
jgi:class 3 adenylate cyclase